MAKISFILLSLLHLLAPATALVIPPTSRDMEDIRTASLIALNNFENAPSSNKYPNIFEIDPVTPDITTPPTTSRPRHRNQRHAGYRHRIGLNHHADIHLKTRLPVLSNREYEEAMAVREVEVEDNIAGEMIEPQRYDGRTRFLRRVLDRYPFTVGESRPTSSSSRQSEGRALAPLVPTHGWVENVLEKSGSGGAFEDQAEKSDGSVGSASYDEAVLSLARIESGKYQEGRRSVTLDEGPGGDEI